MLYPCCHPKPSCQRPVDEAERSCQPIMATDCPPSIHPGHPSWLQTLMSTIHQAWPELGKNSPPGVSQFWTCRDQLSTSGIYKGETTDPEGHAGQDDQTNPASDGQTMDRGELHLARYGS
ncbi:hypothetical protein ACOMHN_041295 [Nucella lapillus]